MALASLNRRSENVIVTPIIVPELELRNVKWQVFPAYLVERADDATLEDAPEALNRLGVNGTNNVLMFGVVNGAVHEFCAEVLVANPLIGAEQADFLRHGLVNESLQGRLLHILNDASDYVALAANSANNNSLAGSSRTRLAVSLIPMSVLGFAADERFVNFNNAAKLGLRFDQSGADFVAHGMRRAVRAEAHDALDLEGANSLLAGQHQMDDAKPFAKRLVRVLKNGARDVREAIAIHLARFALPMKAGRQRVDLGIAATRAVNAVRPASRHEIGAARLLVNKRRFELSDGHLMDWLGALGGHGVSSSVGGYSHG
jgi:hypothetical protein